MFAQSALMAETGKLQKFAMKLTRNKADADDLAQSTYMRAIEKSDYFEDGTNLFAWTSKIMYNIFVTGYRRRSKFESQYDPQIYIDARSIAPVQESHVELDNVRKAMEKLTPEHREILVMVCIKGMQYAEVSTLLAIPVGTVRSRLSRAREQLKFIMDTPCRHIAGEAANMDIVPAYIAAHTLRAVR